MTPKSPREDRPARRPDQAAQEAAKDAVDEAADDAHPDGFLDEEALLDGLFDDHDEVVGLDDRAAELDDPSAHLDIDPLGPEESLQRWHDVGPDEDLVDPALALIPDADESGYTRESDALGIEGDAGEDSFFVGVSDASPSGDEDGVSGLELLGGLELPVLPALRDESEDDELGPVEDAEGLAAELLSRVQRGSRGGAGDP